MRTAALLLRPSPPRSRKKIDNAAAYALANQVADELELVRERMGGLTTTARACRCRP